MFIKKFLAGLMMMTMLFVGYGYAQTSFISEPIVVYADGATIDGIDISMSDGSLSVSGEDIAADQTTAWNKILGRFQTVVMGVTGVGTICMVLFFVMNFIKLGQASSNPSEVAKIKTALLYSGLAAAGLGAVTFIVGLFYGILK